MFLRLNGKVVGYLKLYLRTAQTEQELEVAFEIL
ncbi:hypothetical protein SCAZ3_04420 [Streptococcus canis FSL Z3-227]|uniref:Uncharacterized protein n=1 Tax=Streptococcus canis FSL Z3-227 TaxID=482234 RepID=A0AAV3FRR9_STRCB|nr:hypothetical protein SCAZ3_04420 [Streptococcus canis FSL Z3-227]